MNTFIQNIKLFNCLIERRKNGIPYHPEVIDWFKDITNELSIKWRLS